jgi:AhpD family alkylhydroperoxidase
MHHNYFEEAQFENLKQLTPIEFANYVLFSSIVQRENGAIPQKYRELIAIAVACTTQCPYCLDIRTNAASRAGANRTEVAEAAMLAAVIRATSAVSHSAMALKLFDRSRTLGQPRVRTRRADPSVPDSNVCTS